MDKPELAMTNESRSSPSVSAVIPVCSRFDDLGKLVPEYAEALSAAGHEFEMIVVFDGDKMEACDALRDLALQRPWLRLVELSREFGESAALTAGFSLASGSTVLTLPACYQVNPNEISTLVAQADEETDMLVAARRKRAGSAFDRARRDLFHGIFRFVTGLKYRDLGCTVRLMRRKVIEETPLYGDQHRFFPALAERQGFRVREVELEQSPEDRFRGRPKVRQYLHRLLDILSIFFLIRFTKKPLRFFGTVGSIIAAVGAVLVAALVVQRLFFGIPLADRPALLLSSLLVVLGVQVFALGLIGELIIFTHAGELKEYAIRSVIGQEAEVDGERKSA